MVGIAIWREFSNELTQADSDALLRKYKKIKNSNPKVASEIRNQIFKGYVRPTYLLAQRFVYSFSHDKEGKVKYAGRMDDEDFLQEAGIVLWNAIDKYDIDNENVVKFPTYLTSSIYKRFCQIYKHQKKCVFVSESLDQVINPSTDTFNPTTQTNNVSRLELYADKTQSPENILNNMDVRFILNHIITVLPKRQQQIFKMYYIQGMTQEEIAESFNITREYVYKNLSQIRGAIVNYYNNGIDNDCYVDCVQLKELQKERIANNKKFIDKYGRKFLSCYADILTRQRILKGEMTPAIKCICDKIGKILDCYILNYHGQSRWDYKRENQYSYIEEDVERVRNFVKKHYTEIYEIYKKEGLDSPEDFQTLQKIEDNELFLKKLGGKFFLQKYFPCTLSEIEYRVFRTIMKYDGRSDEKFAQSLDMDVDTYTKMRDKIVYKMKNTNFDDLVFLVDNNAESKFIPEVVDQQNLTLRQDFMRKNFKTRREGKAVCEHLQDDEKIVYEKFFLYPVCTKYSTLASQMGVTPRQVKELESNVIRKVKSFCLKANAKEPNIKDDSVKNF